MNNIVIQTLAALEGELLKDLVPEVGFSPKKKDYSRAIIDLYLNNSLGFDYKAYLTELGLTLKTTPITKGSLTSVEPLRICSINLVNFVNEEWLDSSLYRALKGFLILPFIVEAKNLGQPYRRVGRPIIWIPSDDEIKSVHSDWLTYKEYALRGAVPAKRGCTDDKLTFPTEAVMKFIHMKPHSVKDKFELDSFGNQVRKMAFYLNPPRLRTLLLSQKD